MNRRSEQIVLTISDKNAAFLLNEKWNHLIIDRIMVPGPHLEIVVYGTSVLRCA